MKTSLRGNEEIKKYISTVGRGMKIAAMRAIGEYLLGDDRHGLKHSPPRRQHGENNPYQWQSEKQRRAYFATNGFGKGIPYSRTNQLKSGWKLVDYGVKAQVTNDVPYAGFVMDADQQRGHRADKWRLVSEVIASNIAGMFQSIEYVLQRWIDRNEPK